MQRLPLLKEFVMGWKVILEDENRNEIVSLSDEFYTNPLNDKLKLINYLDPYGDTIFNRLQMKDLISDLEYLLKLDASNQLIIEIISMAEKSLKEPHLYLAFYGD